MTSWDDLVAADADLATRVQGRFAAHRHHILGTLAADGRPRLWGLEVPIRDGHLWLAMMPASRKRADLRRDPRFALHSTPVPDDMVAGDAKIEGRAVEVAPGHPLWAAFTGAEELDVDELPGGGMGLFTADVTRVTLSRVVDDALQVLTWTPTGGRRLHTIA